MSFHRSVFLSRKTTQHFLGKSAQKVLEKVLGKSAQKVLEKVLEKVRRTF